MNIESTVAAQRAYFARGETLDVAFRKDALRRLRETILSHEAQINAALAQDLGKSPSESYMCEVGMTLSELSYTLSHVDRWARRHSVLTPLAHFHARSFTVHNPYGVVLIMSPWNYPFMLTMEPLIGALAAGNCALLKPSAYAPATSAVIREIVSACFPPEYVAVVEGGRKENQALLEQRFDYIFFTGGVTVGREVMRKAAEHLTPVSLELGGKSPCIVDSTAKLDLAAKRLAFGKLLNCGQTCVAPDYLLVDRRVKAELLSRVGHWMERMYGRAPLDNDGYVHMVNRKHFDRVCALIDPAKVVYGGGSDPDALRIQPTILDGVSPDDPVMGDEIFGPLLPVLEFEAIRQAEDFILDRPRPLALYLFSEDKAVQRRFVRHIPFGGGCVNDTIMHLANPRLPFGGVGNSGMGSYHGRQSFETFSHTKSLVQSSTRLDLPVRYAPYTEAQDKLIRRFLK